jgi:hypothetical protein
MHDHEEFHIRTVGICKVKLTAVLASLPPCVDALKIMEERTRALNEAMLRAFIIAPLRLSSVTDYATAEKKTLLAAQRKQLLTGASS